MPKFPWGGGVIPLAVHEQHVPEIQDEKAMQLVQEVPAAVESCSEGALRTIKCPSDGNYPRLEYVTLRPSLNQSTLLIFTHTHTQHSIITVHGLNGHWEKTWTTKSSQPGQPVM